MEKKKASTEAEKIWEEIENLQIEMFALPDQKVSNYCKPFPVNPDPDKLYLISTAGSVLPSLEAALGNKYSVELVNKYLIVTRKVKLGF